MDRLRVAISAATMALVACASARGSSVEPRPPVAPIDVCVDDGGALRAGTATPSWAGTYDPHAPVVPEELNWTVPGVGCVVYPGPAARRASCGGAPRPVATRTLCQQ